MVCSDPRNRSAKVLLHQDGESRGEKAGRSGGAAVERLESYHTGNGTQRMFEMLTVTWPLLPSERWEEGLEKRRCLVPQAPLFHVAKGRLSLHTGTGKKTPSCPWKSVLEQCPSFPSLQQRTSSRATLLSISSIKTGERHTLCGVSKSQSKSRER